MRNDTRGSNHARRTGISKIGYSGKGAGSGPESGKSRVYSRDENRYDPLRKKGSYDRTANQRGRRSDEDRSYKAGNSTSVNFRGEKRLSGTDWKEGKDSVRTGKTSRSDIKRNNSSGGRRTYLPKSVTSNFSDKGNRSLTPPGNRRNIPQNRKLSGRTGTGKTRTNKENSFPESGEMRLNRFIAHSGICSRRQADDFIKAGLVSINGIVVTDMGIKVKPDDLVKYNGESIRSERKVYILLNKPKNYVTTLDDEENRKTVMELIRDACPERVYPVGRLDRNTTGVMLLTNDGELTGKLTHPKYNKKKIYHVFLDKNLKKDDLQAIAQGVTLEDGPITPDSISYVDSAKKSEIGLEIHSGRNRIVRRLFEYFGYKVIRLDRVYFAGLTKKNLPRGKWRFLTEKEIYTLKMNSYE